MRVLGLMSGTSLDGIDAALVRLGGDTRDSIEWRVERFLTRPYTSAERERIHDAIVHGDAAQLCRLDAELGELFAEAALAVCAAAGVAPADVDLIGSHGQTVWHEPPIGGRRGATLQLTDPATIAERTGIDVVSDFRTRDVAAGGEGAPLVPWIDRTLFALPDRTRVLLNIGGIANLTRVPRRGSREPLLAFDTGPGNALVDAAVALATEGGETFDRGGARGARGAIDQALLASLLDDEYMRRPPPRSTGRERYGRPFVEGIVSHRAPRDAHEWDSLIATLTAFTAESIARALREHVLPLGADELIITGGGALNGCMMAMLRERLPEIAFVDAAALGVDPEAKEALAFAVLAWAHVRRIPANEPGATGAAGPRVLGSFTPGRTP
ncbi:MAG TPA: anhydro-N-acetylmuramic acid kinase [Longimicrobiales bacterium]